MLKKFRIAFTLLLLMPLFHPTAEGQSIIIMGDPNINNNLVADVDENPRDFCDPGGPTTPTDDGFFGQNRRDTLTLKTNVNNTVLYVIFDEFAMGDGDSLWIFDGPDVNGILLDIYNLVRNPGEVVATGRSLTFVFHSDNVDILGLRAGWHAQVYALPTQEEVYNWAPGNTISASTCRAFFYDSGGPNGNIASVDLNNDPNFTSYANFISPVGTHIKCEFSNFKVNGVMEIYDGQYADPNKRLIGQFCTSTCNGLPGNKPPTFFSTDNALSFVYKGKNGDSSKEGWAATISCVPELFESTEGSPCPNVSNDVDPMYSAMFNANTKILQWDCDIPIVVLKANVVATGHYSSDYRVEQIPFESHIFDFTEGVEINADDDDVWLKDENGQWGIGLPFEFVFFGKSYDRVYPGTNGLVSMTERHSYDPPIDLAYKYGVPPESPPYNTDIQGNQTLGEGSMTTPYNYDNCIYGVYEDVDPDYTNSYSFGVQGAIRRGVVGVPPCRAFVFNYLNIGLFGNHDIPSNFNTYQIALYEGTNIIDVYVKHRAFGANTNMPPYGHNEGIIGLQNETSSQILLVPGHGMTGWTAQDEAWRFTPVTPLDENGELRWFVNDTANAVYSNEKVITVSKPVDSVTLYISLYRYTDAVGVTRTFMDTTKILVNVPKVHLNSSCGTNNVCPGDTVKLWPTFTGFPNIQPDSYLWSTGETTDTIKVTPSETSSYRLTVTFDNSCDNKDTVKVNVTALALPEITGVDTICFGQSTVLTASHPTSSGFNWSTGQSGSSITVSPQVSTLYTVSATMTGNCTVTDTLTVTVLPLPVPTFIADPTEISVENNIGTVECTTSLSPNDYYLVWNFGDKFSVANEVVGMDQVSHDYTRSGFYTITLSVTDTAGCVDSVKHKVTVFVPYYFYIPNAFSPDGDGVNETFAPGGEGVDPENYSMQIFDRNGVLIFSTRNPYDYWDGRNKWGQMCPEGVYVYLIRLVNLNGDDKEYTGSVTLVR